MKELFQQVAKIQFYFERNAGMKLRAQDAWNRLKETGVPEELLMFTGIEDVDTLPSNIVSAAYNRLFETVVTEILEESLVSGFVDQYGSRGFLVNGEKLFLGDGYGNFIPVSSINDLESLLNQTNDFLQEFAS